MEHSTRSESEQILIYWPRTEVERPMVLVPVPVRRNRIRFWIKDQVDSNWCSGAVAIETSPALNIGQQMIAIVAIGQVT